MAQMNTRKRTKDTYKCGLEYKLNDNAKYNTQFTNLYIYLTN